MKVKSFLKKKKFFIHNTLFLLLYTVYVAVGDSVSGYLITHNFILLYAPCMNFVFVLLHHYNSGGPVLGLTVAHRIIRNINFIDFYASFFHSFPL